MAFLVRCGPRSPGGGWRGSRRRRLLLYRRQDLAAAWPVELAGELDGLNAEVSDALASFPGADRERLVFATVDVPYGAVRRYLLDGRPPPPLVDELVISACRAVLAG